MQLKVLYLAVLLPTALTAPSFLRRRDGWWIRDFSRDCTYPSTCTYNFEIDVGDGSNGTECTVTDIADPATNHSFYDVPCEEADFFHISWGWDYTNDFTVMTVVNETSQMEAFFGYNHPNANATYPDVGPNASQHT